MPDLPLLNRIHGDSGDGDIVVHTFVNAGHAEYMPSLSATEFHEVWHPGTVENEEILYDEQLMAAATGLPPHMIPVDDLDDLSWCALYEINAPRPVVRTALLGLLGDLSREPGGDDDTFDYWPSGAKLALQFAEAVDAGDANGTCWQVAALVLRDTIFRKGEFAGELLDKIGLRQPGDPDDLVDKIRPLLEGRDPQ